jgi:hypothetical protein
VTALVAFADLTCVPQSDRTTTAAQPTQRQRRNLRGSSEPHSAVRHGKTTLAASLAPSAETGELLASYVVGHRRRLRERQQPSPEAVHAADRAGITLRPYETWVRPHMRGAPDDAVLIFAWTPPALLAGPT